MTTPWLDLRKLTPPTPPADYLARDLLEGPLPAVTALVAGAGHGKSLGLLSLLDRLPTQTTRLWLGFDPFDLDASAVFRLLIAGMRAEIPQFGEELDALLAGQAEREPALLWRRFFAAIASFNLPAFALALDDLHHLPDALWNGLMANLAHLPPRVHVLVASRRPLALGPLLARGEARVLGAEALRFSAAEQARYLPAVAAEALDGWPLGLALLKRGGKLTGEQGIALVARELYDAQPADRQAFMRAAALLETPDADACKRGLGLADAESHLAALTAGGLLMDGRFPAYMRDFLRGLPAPAALHRRAAAYYAEKPELALAHWWAAQDTAAAVATFAELAPRWLLQGRPATIWHWLDRFGPALCERDATLALWSGNRHSRAGANVEAEACYGRARALFDTPAGELKALVRLVTTWTFQGDLQRAGAGMLQALALAPLGRPEDVADLQLLRALAAEQRGDLALMREANEAVLALPIAGNVEVAACQAIAHLNLATSAQHHGELARAGRHLAGAREVAQAWGFTAYGYLACYMQADLHLLRGELDEAGAAIAAVPPYWPDVVDWHERGVMLAIAGSHHQARGAWKEAEDALRRATATFERAGYAQGKKVPLERLLWLALARKQYARTGALLAEAEGPGENALQDLALRLPHARALHLAGDPGGALAELTRLVPELEHLEARLHLARARLYQADALQASGQDAQPARAAAEKLIETWDFGFLRPPDGEPRETASPLEIRCFGSFEVLRDGALLTTWPRHKSKLVLAALVVYAPGLRLEELAERLGADELTASVIRTLHADLSLLRKALGPDASLVRFENERYSLAPGGARSDVQAFEQALAGAAGLRERAPVKAAAATREALALYRGNFMEDGLGARYFQTEREAYRRQALEALSWLAGFCQAHNDPTGAEGALGRAIALNPTDEEAYLALMRFQHAWGKRDRLRQTYWDCRKALKARLGLSPSAEFEAASAKLNNIQSGRQ